MSEPCANLLMWTFFECSLQLYCMMHEWRLNLLFHSHLPWHLKTWHSEGYSARWKYNIKTILLF